MKHRDFYVYQVAETVLNTSIRTVGFLFAWLMLTVFKNPQHLGFLLELLGRVRCWHCCCFLGCAVNQNLPFIVKRYYCVFVLFAYYLFCHYYLFIIILFLV